MDSPTILSIESSCKKATLAIHYNGQTNVFEPTNDEFQSQSLIPNLQDLLETYDCPPEALSDIAIHVGPGSSTGLRIGIAMVQAFSLVYPNIQIHAIPLESLALNCLQSQKLSHRHARLLSNAYGGALFSQNYIKQNDTWELDGKIQVILQEDLPSSGQETHILSYDMEKLKAKLTYPESWDWLNLKFVNARNVMDAAQKNRTYLCKIEQLDVRYLRASTAELNWRKMNPSCSN